MNSPSVVGLTGGKNVFKSHNIEYLFRILQEIDV